MSTSSGSTLSLDGSLCLANAAEIAERLTTGLAGQEPVRLDCSGATDADLSFIQLLISFARGASLRGRAWSIVAPEDGAVGLALARGGFMAAGSDVETAVRGWAGEDKGDVR